MKIRCFFLCWPLVPCSPGEWGGRGGQGPLGTATRHAPAFGDGWRVARNTITTGFDWERGTFLADLAQLNQGGMAAGLAGAAGRPAGTARAPDALAKPPASATIFKTDVLKVTFPTSAQNADDEKGEFWRGIVHRCKHWMCEQCKLPRGLTLKRHLLAKAALFKAPRLYTVTINRAWFKSPEEAYNYVMQKKFLARLLTKEMGVRVWLWVLEAQEKNGDGWPHWHILMDVSGLPGRWYHKSSGEARANKPADGRGWVYIPHFFDLNRVHRLLREWKIGEQCKLTVRRDEFTSPEHAINYIVKYLIKMPERGYPPWMYHHNRLRFIQASRALGRLTDNDYPVKGRKRKRRETKPKERKPVERVAECGTRVSFIAYNPTEDRYQFKGQYYGNKETIKAFPSVVAIQDFDFTRQRPFDVYGFSGLVGVRAFEQVATLPEVEAIALAGISQRKTRLLSAWESSNEVQLIQMG